MYNLKKSRISGGINSLRLVKVHVTKWQSKKLNNIYYNFFRLTAWKKIKIIKYSLL